MTNFVISLQHNNEKRRKHIIEQFSSKDINFSFFDAINKDNLYLTDNLNIKFNNQNLTTGEKGCFLSHILIWKKIIEEHIDVAGIFEDDIYLGKNSEYILNDYSWVKKNFDIIKIEKSNEKIKTSIIPLQKNNKISVYRLKSKHLGTAGYIITNKGAKFLLKTITETSIKNPIDHEIFNDLLKNKNYIVGQTIPCLCIQDFVLNSIDDNFPSVLENERIHRSNTENNNNYNKIQREIYRIINQLKEIIIKNTIERKVKFSLNK